MIRFTTNSNLNRLLRSVPLLPRSFSSSIGRSRQGTEHGRDLSSYPAVAALEEEAESRSSRGSPLSPIIFQNEDKNSEVGNQRSQPKREDSYLSYVSDMKFPITNELTIIEPGEDSPAGVWPVFRLMDEDGDLMKHEKSKLPKDCSRKTSETYNLDDLRRQIIFKNPTHKHVIEKLGLLRNSKMTFYDMPSETSTNTLLRSHRQMIRLRAMDFILLNAQRQGRISFYLTCTGEEAIHIGSASALKMQDVVLAQYREAGILMWRGFTLEQFTNQCFSNDLDLGRGRQMPIHYGSRALNYHTISSPLGTQIPQAVGVAYRKKLDLLEGAIDDPGISIVYFGEGAASTGDFHSACNFAATLKTPMIFFCRNNGYAISTSVKEQYAGDGIVSRAPGYGMAGIRVDGNDIFAVHAATMAAREYALKNSAPVLIEAITYRQGHHSTSDDSSQYRDVEEVVKCRDEFDPLLRLNLFLQKYGWLEENEANEMEMEERRNVIAAMELAERRPKPKLETMFEDVYHTKPAHLRIQERDLHEHLAKYPDKYKQ